MYDSTPRVGFDLRVAVVPWVNWLPVAIAMHIYCVVDIVASNCESGLEDLLESIRHRSQTLRTLPIKTKSHKRTRAAAGLQVSSSNRV